MSGGESSRNGGPRDPRDVAAPALLALVSVPLIFWNLGGYGPVNMDELFYHGVARRMVSSGNWLRIEYTGEYRLYDAILNAPLYYWGKAVVITVLGEGWVAMRLISAVCGLASVLVTWDLVRRIESRGAGLLAGLVQLTTFQFLYLHSARTGEMETTIALVLMLCAQLFMRALGPGGSFVAHHLCLLVLAHLKGPLVLVPLCAELAWFALDRAARARFRAWLVLGLWLLPLALAWRVFQALAHPDEFAAVIQKMFAQVSGEERLAARGHGGPLGNLRYYVTIALFGAFPWVLLHPLAVAGMLWRERSRPGPWLLLGLYLGAVTGFFLVVSKHFPWYVIPAYPILSAFTGAWLWRLWRDGPRAGEVAAIGGVLGLAVCIQMPELGFDPFALAARQVDSELAWRGPFGWGPAGAGVVFALGLAAAGAVWRRRAGDSFPSAAFVATLTALALGVAGVRVAAPLRFTDFETPLERLRRQVDAAKQRGEELPYPIEYVKGDLEPGLIRVRYFFAHDFWLVSRRESKGDRQVRVVDLYERSRGAPPTPACRPRGAGE